jgi:hypothetical protein
MRFAKLHDDGGYPVFVNPEAVEKIAKRDVRGGGSTVTLAHGVAHVSEQVEEAARLLEEQLPWREVPPTKMPSHGVPT